MYNIILPKQKEVKLVGTVIAVASGKGGTGKSSFCANLAVALCARGEKVLLIDTDAGLRSLDLILGMTSRVLFSYADVIEGKSSLKDAAVKHETVKNLRLLTAPASPRVFEREQIAQLVQVAREHFTYTIVDCPAGLSDNILDFCTCADRALVVSTPDHTSLRGGQKMGILMGEQGQQNVKIVVNRVRSGMIDRGEAVNIDAAMDQAGLGLIGVVPEDKSVIACGNGGKLLAFEKKSPAWQAYFNIAGRIKGEKIRLLDSVPGRY